MATGCSNVFVYGTLLADEVLAVLLKSVPRSHSALLPDYHRYSIHDRVYPAATYLKGDKLKGKVLFDLTDTELQALDDFEGDEYKRLVVEPFLVKENGFKQDSPLKVFLYVWKDPEDSNLFGDWDYEQWRLNELNKYVEACKDYMSSGINVT